MADAMQFDLVSPERRLSSVQAREVLIPGVEGDLTAMPGHVPTITTLRPGVLRVVTTGGVEEFVVLGGFAEITGAGVSVLAEQAVRRGDLTPDLHARMVEDARSALSDAQSSGRGDEAGKYLADVQALGA